LQLIPSGRLPIKASQDLIRRAIGSCQEVSGPLRLGILILKVGLNLKHASEHAERVLDAKKIAILAFS
jgi:hypothetical protein